jgi:chorismate mutase
MQIRAPIHVEDRIGRNPHTCGVKKRIGDLGYVKQIGVIKNDEQAPSLRNPAKQSQLERLRQAMHRSLQNKQRLVRLWQRGFFRIQPAR